MRSHRDDGAGPALPLIHHAVKLMLNNQHAATIKHLNNERLPAPIVLSVFRSSGAQRPPRCSLSRFSNNTEKKKCSQLSDVTERQRYADQIVPVYKCTARPQERERLPCWDVTSLFFCSGDGEFGPTLEMKKLDSVIPDGPCAVIFIRM